MFVKHTIILSTPPQLSAGNKGHAVAGTPTDLARTLLYCTYSGYLPPSFSIDQSTIPNIPFITEMLRDIYEGRLSHIDGANRAVRMRNTFLSQMRDRTSPVVFYSHVISNLLEAQ